MSAQPWLAVVGVLLVLLALGDAVLTTLESGGGGGPLTRLVTRGLGRSLRRLHRNRRSRLLRATGPSVLVATFLTWNTLLWLGWWLIFSSSDGAVRGATDGLPADATARAYFAGYVVFTLGIGDYVPGDGLWQLLTVLATFLGLALVTLAITYLVGVVSAAVLRRRLAQQVSALGDTGAQLVLLYWNGGWDSSLSSQLRELTSSILEVTEQHLAYPVLHAFTTASPRSNAPRALAVLDDALVLMSAGVAEGHRPSASELRPLQRALEHYTQTVTDAGAAGASPAPPELAPLRAAGVPTVDDGAYAAALEAARARRHRLAQLVASGGARWPSDA